MYAHDNPHLVRAISMFVRSHNLRRIQNDDKTTTHSLRQIVGRKSISFFFLLLARIVLLPFTNPTCVDINNNSNGIFRAWIAFCLESCSSRYSHRHRYRGSFAAQAQARQIHFRISWADFPSILFYSKKFGKNRCIQFPIRWARAHWVSGDYWCLALHTWYPRLVHPKRSAHS